MLATPFVQGHLRNEPVSITVETRCEHCGEPITFVVDSDMHITAVQPGAKPMVFSPAVEVLDIEAPTIVDDF